MNKSILYILGALLLVFLGGVIGRLTTPNKTTTITLTPNVDSIKTVLLRGKMDSASYRDLLVRYTALKNLGHDTILVYEGVIGDGPITTSAFVLDTVLRVNYTAIAGEDTIEVEGRADASLSVTYLYPPLNVFAVDNLSLRLPPVSVPVKRIDPSINFDHDGFGLKALAGVSGGIPGLGAGLELGPVEIGSLYHTNKSFTFLAGWKF